MSRRTFVATGTLGAVATFLAACSSDSSESTGPVGGNVTVNTGIRIADYPALATVGGIARVSGTSTPVAVVRAATDRYRAFSLICPHQGATVAIQGTGFRCPEHGATFNGSGTWTGGERTSGLKEFIVTLNATAGTLTIT